MDLGLTFDIEPFCIDGFTDSSLQSPSPQLSTVANTTSLAVPTIDPLSLRLFDTEDIDPTHFLQKIDAQKQESIRRANEIKLLEESIAVTRLQLEKAQSGCYSKANELTDLECIISAVQYEIRTLSSLRDKLHSQHISLKNDVSSMLSASTELPSQPVDASGVRPNQLAILSQNLSILSAAHIAHLLSFTSVMCGIPTVEDINLCSATSDNSIQCLPLSFADEILCHLIYIKSTPKYFPPQPPQLPGLGDDTEETTPIRDFTKALQMRFDHFQALKAALACSAPLWVTENTSSIRIALRQLL